MRILAVLFLLAASLPAAQPRNVVVVLVDDLGATDLGCYGSKFYETPHIDRLAAESMKFTQAYSACTVCSPTRAALLTGKYPARLHLTDWIAGHERPFAKLRPPAWTQFLPLGEITLAEAFKKAGFTTGQIGKWHLGGPEHFPAKQGFDVALAGTNRGQPPSYFSPYKIPTLPDGPEDEFLTDREGAEACKFIEDNRAKPFFLYLPHYAVHTPLMGKKEVIAKYAAKAANGNGQGKPAYAALIESVDDSIGRIRAKLEELKLWDQTIFVFTSDNGGLLEGGVTQNLGIRAGKGSAYEGGVRTPLLIRAPGLTKAASLCAVPVITPDLFPTLLDVAGVESGGALKLDGVNIKPLLAGGNSIPRDAIFWHYPHYHPGGATPYSAIRQGTHKLIHFYEDGRDELYDLAGDPAESTDLAMREREVAARLSAALKKWLEEIGAQMPEPNPKYDSARDRGPAARRG